MRTTGGGLCRLIAIVMLLLFAFGTFRAYGCDEKPKAAPMSDAKPVKTKKRSTKNNRIPRGASGCGIATPTRVRVGSALAEPLAVERVKPIYPGAARKQGIQGTVVLDVVFGKDGNVISVRPMSAESLLTPAAVDAVKKWRFRPYLLNGEPIEVETTVSLKFSLPQNGASLVAYNGRPLWSETKSKVSEDLVSAYECWWRGGSGEAVSPGCKSENGTVVVHTALVNESPDFASRLKTVSTDSSPSHPALNEYVFRIDMGFLPLLADMPEVKSVELVAQEDLGRPQ